MKKIVYKLLSVTLMGAIMLCIFGECLCSAAVNTELVNDNNAVVLSAKNITSFSDSEIDPTSNSILTGEESVVTWQFNATAGDYQLEIVYISEKGSGIDAQRNLFINDSTEQKGIELHLRRRWIDIKSQDGDFLRDIYGNELRPSQKEKPIKTVWMARDFVGYVDSTLTVKLIDGINTLTLKALAEPVRLYELRLIPKEEEKKYKEVLAEYSSKGYKTEKNEIIVIEGEDSTSKTDPVLYATADRSSADVSEIDPYRQIVNKIGGTAWNTRGQAITWKINVSKSALYTISLKVRKSVSKGLNTYRRLYIDGTVPFAEAESLKIPYSSKWEMLTLGGEEPYLFYLEKGEHELTLEATCGEMGEILGEVKDSLNRMNAIYRKIIIVTGTEPDINRNYHFEEIMPDVIESIKKEYKTLKSITNKAVALSGEKGESFTSLDASLRTLKKLYDNPESIAKHLSDFKANIGSVGTWLNDAGGQSVELDLISIASGSASLPEARVGFFKRLWFSISSLLASYIIDYNSIGDTAHKENNKDAVTVWIAAGREQYQALKSLVNNDFLPKSKSSVDLKLVDGGILLSSIVAGVGPDVSLSTGDVVNYALRGALVDISQFSDYEKIVSERFSNEELVPFKFNGGVYALPETVSFPVLFYRKDILAELELDVPKTWDDVTRIISILSKNNMAFGLGSDLTTYFTFIAQSGGKIYNDEGSLCAFGDEQGVKDFQRWTNYFINYSLPLSFDFQNRFRTGEMPIGIAAYSMYNTLAVAAPEINGLWDFTLIPGTQKSDGSINHSACLTTTGCVIISQTNLKNESWEFLKWWTSAETQLSYGSELESILGPSARYATANMQAFAALPWRVEQRKVLLEQFECSKAIPDVPGGYFTTRHVQNAFRKVVLQGADAKDTLLEYINTINSELVGKRKEYGLSVSAVNGGESDE